MTKTSVDGVKPGIIRELCIDKKPARKRALAS
jgi:hypothetical protein